MATIVATVLLLCQGLALGFLAAWLFTGVRDNIRYPDLNETETAEVLAMSRMRQVYPREYGRLAHRAITGRAAQKALFRVVVAAQILVVAALAAGVVCLGLAAMFLMPPQPARAVALAGAAGFTAIWAAFLVAGNHFAYHFCHQDTQRTHFHLAVWGLATMILLAAG